MKKTAGFAMLEVLISMLLIMIGVLGIAGMQMFAINNTENARYQSLAVILASGMAAMMQANVAYWSTPPVSIIVNGATITGGPAATANDCTAVACAGNSGGEMAYYDLKSWGSALAAGLPSGTGVISCPTGSTPAICKLTLTWSEKNTALSNPTGAESGVLATGTVNANYTYSTLVSIQL